MARIFYYTSTGNCLHLAKEISKEIKADIQPIRLDAVTCNEDVIGIIFPVFFWGLPKTVEEFLKKLRITSSSPYIFSLASYGDKVIGVNGRVEQLLQEKGHHCSYSAKIKSVENYLPMYQLVDKPLTHEKEAKKTADVIQDILARKKNSPGHYGKINELVMSRYPALHSGNCDKKFVLDGCVGCGICEKVCTRKNISMADGKPVFGGDCELCLTCLHACPKNAINWDKTEGKEQYRNPNITLKELIEGK